MMPRTGAADSGPSALSQMGLVCRYTGGRGLRGVGLTLLVALLSSVSGCCCYNDCVDGALKRTEARMAYSEPCECSPTADYKRGWRAGYLDVSEGRSGIAPAMPPHRYRTYKYQTGSGKQATAEWYQGFAAGAAAAKCQGLDLANRIYSVQTPCCGCEDRCQCPSSGALPSAEAVLRRQAMSRPTVLHEGPIVEERIIEQRVIDDRPAGAMPVPAPAPEVLDSPPGAGASMSPVDPQGPELDIAEEPAPAPKVGSLVERQIAPPSAVELPSNAEDLQRTITTPGAPAPRVAKAPEPIAAVPLQSDRAATRPAPVATPRTESAPQGPVVVEANPTPAPVTTPKSQAVATSPEVVLPPVVVQPDRQPSPPYRFKPFEPAPVAATPEPEFATPLTQPGTILLDQPSRPQITRRQAPSPRAEVRDTPTPKPSTAPIAQRAPAMPPQPFPATMVVEPETADLVDVPDNVSFPSSMQPAPQAVVAEPLVVRPRLEQPGTTIAVPPFAASVSPEDDSAELSQPRSLRAGGGSSPSTTKPAKAPEETQRQSALPRKLVVAPDRHHSPQKVSQPARDRTRARLDRDSARQGHLQQPASLRTTAVDGSSPVAEPIFVPSQLSYPADIRYSLHDHKLESIATPLDLSQPENIKPYSTPTKHHDIQFPKTVWPAAYEVTIPPHFIGDAF